MDTDISIVIPMYNEVQVLEESINKIIAIMDITKFSYELILIDDASTDGTVDIVNGLIRQWPNARFLIHKENKGRGTTVAEGIMVAKGRIAGFIDIDLSTNPIYIPLLAYRIKNGADVATAHRIYKLNFSCITRWLISKGYNVLFKFFTGIPLKDTETGCKFFDREKILPILGEIKDKHWFWDTEVMALTYLKGFNIEEVPTIFVRREEFGSKVKIIKDSLKHFFNLMRFRRVVMEYKKCSFPYPILKGFCKSYFEKLYLFLKYLILPMRRIEKMVPREGRILDLGCGKGIFASYLALTSQGRDVIGLDLCSRKIGVAKDTFGLISNLSFVTEDALKLLSNKENLSGIIISDFLHHIDYPLQEKLLRLAYQSLSSRGVMVVKEIDKNGSLRYFSSKLSDYLLYFRDKICYRSQSEWVDLLKRIGFQVENRPAHTIFGSTVLYICKKLK